MLSSYLKKVMSGACLTQMEAESLAATLVAGADPSQAAALLALMRYRGETAEELAGMASAFLRMAQNITLDSPVLEIAGTGGDGANTVNISTGTAILAAACGLIVAKSGNRAASSRCGGADVLEALGIDIAMPPEQLQRCVAEVGIGFLFAPNYHPAFKKIAPIRQSLKIPNIFNLLGPLLNPTKPSYALIGTANNTTQKLIAEAVLKLGVIKRALIFSCNGIDELAPFGQLTAYEIRDGALHTLDIDTDALGLPRCTIDDLRGGTAPENAAILIDAFRGNQGAVADTLVLNTACALYVCGKVNNIANGVTIARQALESGKALEVSAHWRQFSQHTQSMPIQKIESFLDKIAIEKQRDVELLKRQLEHRPDHRLQQLLRDGQKPSLRFSKALQGSQLAVIAEIKKRSPSKGQISSISDPLPLALEYCQGGAGAISVLTDAPHFGGSLDDLKSVSQALADRYPDVGTLRKDFIIDSIQIAEAALAGASAVLLIVALVGEKLKSLLAVAAYLGLEALTEVHDEAELALAIDAGATIIGVNNRNLQTFHVDLATAERLRHRIPKGVIAIAESGIHSEEDAQRMANAGYDAILVGEALVRSASPAQLLPTLRRPRHEN